MGRPAACGIGFDGPAKSMDAIDSQSNHFVSILVFPLEVFDAHSDPLRYPIGAPVSESAD
jgi:hypothetical protein